jgi:hypothetical protein
VDNLESLLIRALALSRPAGLLAHGMAVVFMSSSFAVEKVEVAQSPQERFE